MRIKICGITTIEDAQLAVELGASALGFNFYEQSPRYISPQNAEAIINKLPSHITTVGIFVNAPLDLMKETIATAHIQIAQLHGDESIELCREIPIPVIKAVRPKTEADLEKLNIYFDLYGLLVDTPNDTNYGGTGERANWLLAAKLAKECSIFLAGGLNTDNILEAIETVKPSGIDICTSIESTPGRKSPEKLKQLFQLIIPRPERSEGRGISCLREGASNEGEGVADLHSSKRSPSYFGPYGGTFAPETLMRSLHELNSAFTFYSQDPTFQKELNDHLNHFVGRPTPLTFAKRLTEHLKGANIYFKREDLNHTGAHKINNALGQALLAKKMGKARVIAETGAGQHGVATATACALLGLACTVYMGSVDMQRQALNVKRMRFLGAEVKSVDSGSCTLKDAVSEAMRDWTANVDSYYLLGSALGPHPYPTMVREFQKIIGIEARKQILTLTEHLPDELVACIGGGSNAIGLFHPFLNDKQVAMTGVEAGGEGLHTKKHASRMEAGSKGIFQGTHTFLLQDDDGQISETHSISAGLDYPAIGPEHAYLHDTGRITYTHATDEEALTAAFLVSKMEGIIPALESAHALAYAIKRAPHMHHDQIMIVNISGRGDKDIETLSQVLRGETC